MKISAYITMDEATLPESAAQAAHMAGGEWIVVCARNGRQLVSVLAPPEMVVGLLALLVQYHPIVVGAWDINGDPYTTNPDNANDYPINISAYLDVMPDEADGSRPLQPRDLCGCSGWAERNFYAGGL